MEGEKTKGVEAKGSKNKRKERRGGKNKVSVRRKEGRWKGEMK